MIVFGTCAACKMDFELTKSGTIGTHSRICPGSLGLPKPARVGVQLADYKALLAITPKAESSQPIDAIKVKTAMDQISRSLKRFELLLVIDPDGNYSVEKF